MFFEEQDNFGTYSSSQYNGVSISLKEFKFERDMNIIYNYIKSQY